MSVDGNALILNSAKPRAALIVLDEIGPTGDIRWLSLAWAVIEHIQAKARSKTIFATHYHELTELATCCRASRTSFAVGKRKTHQLLRTVEAGPQIAVYGIEVPAGGLR